MKHDLLKNKKNLKGKPGCSNIFIGEDLTRIRSRMFKMIRQSEKVKSAYTRDGKIICVVKENDKERVVTVDTPDDLFKLGYSDVDMERLGLSDFSAPYSQPSDVR